MVRKHFTTNDLSLSYLDWGGDGIPVVALHAHWMQASTFASLGDALAPTWRVIALDQRGHGCSDHAERYGRDDYISDLLGFFNYLELRQAAIVGNSLGGVNAYQFAARHPTRVTGMVIEDIGVMEIPSAQVVADWEGVFATRKELEERVGARMTPYLKDSFRRVAGGWTLAFSPADMLASQANVTGNYWHDWPASSCPTLLIRGRDSFVTTEAHLEEMASRRPNTQLLTLSGGHVLHIDDAAEFESAVQTFLRALERTS